MKLNIKKWMIFKNLEFLKLKCEFYPLPTNFVLRHENFHIVNLSNKTEQIAFLLRNITPK